jgi:hypothetical protein
MSVAAAIAAGNATGADGPSDLDAGGLDSSRRAASRPEAKQEAHREQAAGGERDEHSTRDGPTVHGGGDRAGAGVCDAGVER